MKTLIKLSFGMFLVLFFMGCTKNFEKINTDPNQPAEVTTPTLLTAAMKGLGDDMYDEWWGGRQSMLWAQYWSQRNYTSEDRYAIRQNINNQYWRLIYHDVENLQEVIRLNQDGTTKVKAAAYGSNANQIAVATILKVWAMQIMADTYGDIPYSNAFKGRDVPTPSYDKLSDIYTKFQEELKNAVDSIDESQSGFTSGDVVYHGDMGLWKKFGNSLRLRVAIRMSARDNYAAAHALVNEVGESGFFTSNSDNAVFAYIGASPNNSPLYDAYWTSARNDFTVSKPFINILKGVDDTLNGKINPFHGLVDPRLSIYSRPRKGAYVGMPYGMTDGQTQSYWSKKLAPSFYGPAAYDVATAPVILNPKYPIVFMEYAEVEFNLCELNNWDMEHYIAGVKASIEHWRDLAKSLEGWSSEQDSTFAADYQAYIDTLPTVAPPDKQTVLTQKYLAFYDQAYQAWAEYRRTGEPEMLLKPGEKTSVDADGNPILFDPLVNLTTVPNRLTYPQQEYTVNATSVTNAATAVGGDEMNTLLWWQPGYTGGKK